MDLCAEHAAAAAMITVGESGVVKNDCRVLGPARPGTLWSPRDDDTHGR